MKNVEQLPAIEENELREAAESVGLFIDIPEAGTPAYSRLKKVCEQYTETVVASKHAAASPVLNMNEKAIEGSQKNRRSFHNQLCVMLFGTTWHDTDPDDRCKISNFAVIIGGRSEYVGTF